MAGLAALGVGRGDRVAAVLKNRREAVELYWACQWLGAVFVPLSWRVAPADVAYCVTDSAARLVVFEEVSLEHAVACAGRGGALRRRRDRWTWFLGRTQRAAASGRVRCPCQAYGGLLASAEVRR